MDITQFIVSNRDNALQVLGGYSAYWASLSRRILTLRRRLGRSTPKNSKFTPKDPITAADISSNHEFVHLQLLVSERAWAHAMALKTSHTEVNPQVPRSARQHIVSRLHKAAKYAKELADVMTSDQKTIGASDTDVLEASAYAYSLTGGEEFERHASSARSGDQATQKSKWSQCLANYSAAQVIYSALLRATKKDVFKEILASTVDPSIRYAAYQSHLPRTAAVEDVAKQHFPETDKGLASLIQRVDPSPSTTKDPAAPTKSPKARDVPTTVTWRSRKANIVDASVGQALAAVSTAEVETEGYDAILIASQDAVDATRRAIEELEREGVDEGDPRMQDLRITSLVVNYELVAWRVGRNRTLIGKSDGMEMDRGSGAQGAKKKKRGKKGSKGSSDGESRGRIQGRLRDRVVLYNAILQSIDSVKDLRGAMRDNAFVEELEGKRAYFQALKCLNIAYSHILLSSPLQALALLSRAASLSRKAPSAIPEEKASPSRDRLKLDVSPSQAQNLHSRLQSLVLQYQGLVELQKFHENSTLAAKKNLTSAAPIVQRLSDYPTTGVDLNNLVTYPPKLEPVPVKPLFLDVAWNYIDYPGREPEARENGAAVGRQPAKGAAEEKPKKRGWFGFGGS